MDHVKIKEQWTNNAASIMQITRRPKVKNHVATMPKHVGQESASSIVVLPSRISLSRQWEAKQKKHSIHSLRGWQGRPNLTFRFTETHLPEAY